MVYRKVHKNRKTRRKIRHERVKKLHGEHKQKKPLRRE